MELQITFKPTLTLLASILMTEDTNNRLPMNISKTWIKSQFTNHFYIHGISILQSEYYKEKYMLMAMELNNKYTLKLG